MPRQRSPSKPTRSRAAAALGSAPNAPSGEPIEAAAEQAARWAQVSTQSAVSLLDAQAAWFKGVEAAMTQWMSPWLARDGRITFGSAQDLVEPDTEGGPLAPWLMAQRFWTESAKAWLLAMAHDVQEKPAAPR